MSSRDKTNYAITGNKGLIGTYLKERLDKEGYNCVLQIDKREGFDIMDLMFKDVQLTEIPDIFFHFAAQCKINEAIAHPILPHKNNVDGILSVLEFCRKHQIPRIVTASSSRVLSPERNPYVASKIYLEELVKAYTDCYNMQHIIIRPSTVYGPMKDETSRLMSNWITSALKGEDLKLYGDRTKTLDFTYIDDFIDGVMLTLRGRWNRTYNISGGEEVNLWWLAHNIIEQANSSSKVVELPAEKAQPQHVRVKTSRIRKLGFKPKVRIEDGVKKMLDFYRTHPKELEEYEDKGAQFYGR